ncbi:MAG: thioredoxin family protein [Candidatus Brocadiia bacterium]
MVWRIVAGVAIGGGVGLAVGMAGKSVGGECPILCNPYISTGLGVFLGLLLASRSGGVDRQLESPHLLRPDTADAYRRLIASEDVLLVAFYTQHCPSCHEQMTVVDNLADRFAGGVAVAAADARRLDGIVEEEAISAVPTMLLYKRGERIRTMRGLTPEEELVELLERYSGEEGA